MTGYIALDQIVIKDRQRQDFDEAFIAELAESITEVGLLNAIVLQNDAKTLSSGENRVKAVQLINLMGQRFKYGEAEVPEDAIPFVVLDDLPEHLRIQAELDENRHRRNLSVQEEALAIARYHELREKLLQGQATLSDTAHELDYAKPAVVSDALTIADNMHLPGVQKAGSKREALKVIEKAKTAEHHERLAKEFDDAKTVHHALRNQDCISCMLDMPDHCVDVTCTDPPYGIGAEGFGSQSSTRHKYDDSYEQWRVLMHAFLEELYRISKRQSHAYIFCDYRRFGELVELGTAAGWSAWPRPLIWYKRNGMLPRPEHGPRNTYETIAFFNKGDRKVLAVKDDVIDISSVDQPRWGPEKPVALYQDLLGRSVAPGNHVADFFAGTGPILPAANRLRCVATAVEIEEEPFGIMTTRVDDTEEV